MDPGANAWMQDPVGMHFIPTQPGTKCSISGRSFFTGCSHNYPYDTQEMSLLSFCHGSAPGIFEKRELVSGKKEASDRNNIGLISSLMLIYSGKDQPGTLYMFSPYVCQQ